MVPLLSRSVRKFRGGRGSEGVKNGTGYFYVDCRSEALVGTALSDPYLKHACYRRFHAANSPVIHHVDANTMPKLSEVGDELIKLYQWLNDRGDIKTASRPIPIMDRLNHLIIEMGGHGQH
jgi:hypothetical protein